MIKSLFSRNKPDGAAAKAPRKSLFASIAAARKSGALEASGDPDFDRTKIAAATLMVEVARLDTEYAPSEIARMREILCRHFALEEGECEQLLELAEHRHEEAYTNWLFTKTLKEKADLDERREIMEFLWEIAYADGELQDLEADLLLRIGQAIGLPEAERIKALERMFTARAMSAMV